MNIFLKSFILLLFIGLSNNQMAAQGFDYAYQFGSSSSSLEQGEVLATDDTGNVYLAGQFAGTTDFDPGSGVFQLTPTGSIGFIAKYDSLGTFVWAKMFDSGFNGGDISFGDIALEENGNIVLTGHFTGEIVFARPTPFRFKFSD